MTARRMVLRHPPLWKAACITILALYLFIYIVGFGLIAPFTGSGERTTSRDLFVVFLNGSELYCHSAFDGHHGSLGDVPVVSPDNPTIAFLSEVPFFSVRYLAARGACCERVCDVYI